MTQLSKPRTTTEYLLGACKAARQDLLTALGEDLISLLATTGEVIDRLTVVIQQAESEMPAHD